MQYIYFKSQNNMQDNDKLISLANVLQLRIKKDRVACSRSEASRPSAAILFTLRVIRDTMHIVQITVELKKQSCVKK